MIFEDSAALLGLIIVLISTFLAWQVNPIFDAIGSIMVGVLLLVISIMLIIEVKALLIGESIPRDERNKIKEIIHSYQKIKHINRVQTMVTGNHKYMVLLSVDLEDDMKIYDAENLIDKIKAEIISHIPEIETIYIEIKDAVRNQ
ncbi:MAG: hypothetical protein IPH45_02800 [Bacteroidales bacterium]|nr:hypothetical protein [Bacteroidales bacterium]